MKNRVLVKFSHPVLDRVWHRESLFTELTDYSSAKLIWVSAPPGYGKTTLITDYIETCCSHETNLWYRLDQADIELASFLYHLNLWIKKIPTAKSLKLPEYEESAVSDLQAYLRSLCRSLVSHIDTETRLVFDDAHLLRDNYWFDIFIGLLVQEAPEALQLIIISRYQLPDNLLAFQAKNQIHTLSQEALTLTESEVVEITSRLAKHAVSSLEQKQIFSLTKGWISGIILLLNQDKSTLLDHYESNDYLPENIFQFLLIEIFQQQTKDVQQFLLYTSLMRRFTIHMAKQLTSNNQTAEILNWLTERNYFTYKFHGFPSEFEYHSLFRSFLNNYREENIDTEELFSIRQSAAQILEENQSFDEAFDLYIMLQDWNAVCRLLVKVSKDFFKQGRSTALLEWLNAVPAEFMEKLPWLNYWRARCLQDTQAKHAITLYEASYSQFMQYNDFEGSLLSCAGVLESMSLSCDDFTQVEHWMDKYRFLRKGAGSKITLETKIQTTASIVLTMCTGQINVPWMERNLRFCDYAFHFVPLTSSRVMIGSFLGLYYGMMGEVGKLKALVHHLRPALNKYQGQAMPKVIGYLVLVLHDMLTLSENVHKSSQQGLEFSAESGIHLFDELFYSYAGYSSLISNTPSDASVHFTKQGALADTERRMQLGHYIFVLAWQALVNEDRVTALEHAEKALSLAHEIGFSFGESLSASLLSNICITLQDTSRCNDLLNRAEEIAIQTKSALLLFSANVSRAWYLHKTGQDELAIPVLKSAFELANSKELYCFGGWYPKMMNELCRLAISNDVAADYSYKLIQRHEFVPDQSALLDQNWPWKMRLYVLGQFKVTCNRQELPLNLQKRSLELLQFLVVEGGLQVSYEKIIAKLWPQTEADAALKALETTLYRLRKSIGKELIQVKHSQVSLDKNQCWCDLWAVDEILKTTRQQNKKLTNNDLGFTELLSLYQGPLLADIELFWAIPTRERIHTEVLRAIEAECCLIQSPADKEHLLLKGIELDPLHEPFYLKLMQHFEQLGHISKIISTYRRLESILAAELGVAPASYISAFAEKYLIVTD